MSTVILYTTKYGTAAKCAGILKEKTSEETQIINLKESPDFNFKSYSSVILGASVYVEKIQKEMSAFCEKNREELLKKKVGLFICSGDTGTA
ncbi:MAG: flavodoxin, partial [Candidatus Sabulitectum sp.]|nr:flavodoxin [Candidatus Sabulitectum sp.]